MSQSMGEKTEEAFYRKKCCTNVAFNIEELQVVNKSSQHCINAAHDSSFAVFIPLKPKETRMSVYVKNIMPRIWIRIASREPKTLLCNYLPWQIDTDFQTKSYILIFTLYLGDKFWVLKCLNSTQCAFIDHGFDYEQSYNRSLLSKF